MVLGLIVRVRIHDAPRLMLPAALRGALNAVLVVLFSRSDASVTGRSSVVAVEYS